MAAQLMCKCKRPRCIECLECSRCGCDHDGKSVEEKLRRKKGKPPAPVVVETPPRSVTFKRDARLKKRFSSPAPQSLTPILRPLPRYTNVLRFFGEHNDTIDYIRSHLPTKNLRADPDFWSADAELEAPAKASRLVVMNMFLTVLTCVAESLNGVKGGAASLESFRHWFADATDTPDTPRAPVVLQNSHSRLHLWRTATAFTHTTKGSIERRVIRAALCGSFVFRQLQHAEATIPGFHIGTGSYTQGRKDYDKLTEDGKLQVKRYSRRRFNKTTVDKAISYILAHDNVSYLSWGTRRIRYNQNVYEVPSLLRKRPINVMYDNYSQPSSQGGAVSKSTFYRLCDTLTKGETQARKAVDYVTGFLVSDSFQLLERIVVDLIPREADELKLKLGVLQAWLKYGTTASLEGQEVEESDKRCARHDIAFGLLPPSRVSRVPVCAACEGFHKLMAYITRQLQNAGADERTLGVVGDIQNKAQLFLGHRLRVLNQQREIEKVMKGMEERCFRTRQTVEALVVFDFKMKSEPMYFRETTAAHFGKRGMSWHGALVRYWEVDPDDPESPACEEKLYYDHISKSDNLQDKGAVISLLESTMMSLKRDLPTVTELVGQSDNASSYQNACVKLLFPVIGAAHGFWARRYIHSDTQDGKSVLDAHFAQAGRKIGRWVQQGNNCVTPTQLVVGVTANGGMPNTSAELIKYSRPTIAGLLARTAPMEQQFNKMIGRANDIFYSKPKWTPGTQGEFTFGDISDFDIVAFSYSGVGEGTKVHVSFRDQKCTRESDVPGLVDCGDLTVVDDDLEGGTMEPNEAEDETALELESEDFQAQEEATVDDEDDEDIHSEDDYDDIGSDDEGTADVSFEPVIARSLCGPVTKVSITTISQIRRRMRKWKSPGANCEIIEGRGVSVEAPIARDVVTYAKYQLLQTKHIGGVAIVSACQLSDQLAAVTKEIPSDERLASLLSIQQGWARRPPRGQMYGAKYIHAFTSDIHELFEQGVQLKSDKLGPARMLEDLAAKYPGRYDLPSESEIRAEIGKLFTKARKRPRSVVATTEEFERLVRPRKQAQPAITTFLEEMIRAKDGIKPAEALAMYREQFGNVHDQTDKQIKAKFAYIKKTAASRQVCQTPPPTQQSNSGDN